MSGLNRKLSTEDDGTLYSVQFAVRTKEFLTQKNSKSIGNKTVEVDSLGAFKINLWDYAKQFINKEMIVGKEEKALRFSDNDPEFENIDKFIQFNDPLKRKCVKPWKITSKDLRAWGQRPGETLMYIYEYSTSINCFKLFTKLNQTLLNTGTKDRAGAFTNSRVFEVTQELKQIWELYYSTFDCNWRIWADIR